MSLRANDPGPSLPDDFGQQKRSLIPYIIAAVVVAAVATVAFLAVTGRVQLPFVGKPVETHRDALWQWQLTFPKAWATKSQSSTGTTGIRFQSEGDNVGVRVQAEPLTGVVTPAESRSSELTSVLTKSEGPSAAGRPDATILSGPNFGTINGAPYDQYLVDFHDYSTGVGVLLEDTDYFIFNGANLEIVTFETDQKYFATDDPQFVKAVKTFHSKYLSEGVPSVSPSGVTSTATTSPSAPASPTTATSPSAPPASPTVATSPTGAASPVPSTSASP